MESQHEQWGLDTSQGLLAMGVEHVAWEGMVQDQIRGVNQVFTSVTTL